ncbi:MAG: hypothetical protein IJX39_05610 [Clostridia bacterium]|nr:hypothetical protein [Clostridia bacterium]
MQETANTKALLRRSADVKFYKSHMLVMSVMVAFFTLLGAVCVIATDSPSF